MVVTFWFTFKLKSVNSKLSVFKTIVVFMDINELMNLIKNGEGETLEFKSSVTDLGRTVSAFANTYGGTILIGIDDQGEVIGIHGKKNLQEISDSFASVVPPPKVKISTINIGGRIIAAVEVEKSQHLYSHKNIVYIRVGRNNRPLAIHEVVEKAGESLQLFFDDLDSGTPASRLDRKLIKEYFERREAVRGVKEPIKIDDGLLVKLRILKKHHKKLMATNGGLLFFGKEPQELINSARIHLVHFSDMEMQTYTDQRIFEGSLWRIIEEVEVYFRQTIRRTGGKMKGFERIEKFEYPLEALREAILNAVVHRNYFDAGDIKIFILPDRIIIKNPGSFPPGVTPEIPEHRPRNPSLSQYFYDVGLIEKYGSGIEKMKRLCGQTPHMTIDFELRPSSTTVVFKMTLPKHKSDQIDESLMKRLGTGPASSTELASLTKMSRQAVIKRLNDLIKAGDIVREGSGAAVYYKLKRQ